MIKSLKILSVGIIISCVALMASADRGGFIKKNKCNLNITTKGSLKNSIAFNLKSGLTFRGSQVLNNQQVGNVMVSDAYVSYKKGNSIYIIPYKQKILIPQFSSEGYKLIIRPRK